MRADAKTTAGVRATLSAFADAYAARDRKALEACFAPDPDLILIGTGADERRVGWPEIKAQVERDWAQCDAVWIVSGPLVVSSAGTVAWASGDRNVHVRAKGREFSLAARVTYVLERRGDRWLIVHSHSSIPNVAQSEGDSF